MFLVLICLVPEEGTSLYFSLWAPPTKIVLRISMHSLLSFPQKWLLGIISKFFPNILFAFSSCLWLGFSTRLVVPGLFYCCLLLGIHYQRSATEASGMPQQPWLGAQMCQLCVGCLSPKLSLTASGSLNASDFPPAFIQINKMSGLKMHILKQLDLSYQSGCSFIIFTEVYWRMTAFQWQQK